MAIIQILYKEKEMPVYNAVKLYKESFRATLLPVEIKEFHKRLKHASPAFEDTTDWNLLQNDLLFTKSYMQNFSTPELAVWIAYESLLEIFNSSENGITDAMQVFSYKKHKFWVKAEGSHIVFLNPEDY